MKLRPLQSTATRHSLQRSSGGFPPNSASCQEEILPKHVTETVALPCKATILLRVHLAPLFASSGTVIASVTLQLASVRAKARRICLQLVEACEYVG